jgi:hypothetical protein
MNKTSKQLYNKYKGKYVKGDFSSGIIVGYDPTDILGYPLIIGVVETSIYSITFPKKRYKKTVINASDSTYPLGFEFISLNEII